MFKNYHVALVLGGGIKEDGSLPDSAKARVKKAVELLNANKVDKILFCGKWTYKIKYLPPITEAQAMRNHAEALGANKSFLLTEAESITTVTNFCNAKKIILQNNWNRIILVTLSPLAKRAMLNMKKVFGKDFTCKIILTDFQFDKIKEKELKIFEKDRLKEAKRFLGQFKDGDDEKIFKEATRDLKENYLKG
jgi:uncharacterized SAM-binding protein YcdF (DUF218 family)